MAKRTVRTIPQARTPMREQDAKARGKNFSEVACGYSLEDALREAQRCLYCPEPACVEGCPVSIDIPGFIRRIEDKDFRGAYDVITAANLLPAICGRVCPQENQCEGVCPVGKTLEPVAIGRLERYVGDRAIAEGWSSAPFVEPRGLRIGIVGSGPAGMACAADMAKAGCDVTVYEAFQEPGGVLKYGIPDFRLPNPVIDAEIDNLRKLGVKFECNTLVGRLFTIAEMIEEMGFHAVFIGTGAGYPSMMGIPGESLNGVLSANELLTRCNLMRARQFPQFDTPLPAGKKVAVVGSGNTAMDALRVSLRLGAEKVHCIYRRTKAESPARAEELHHAEEEGIEFHWLTNPVEILDDGAGNVRAMRCIRMELGEPDESGRRRPLPVKGSEFEFPIDIVVYAIGTNANPIIGQTSKLKLNKRGYIETDKDLATSMAGVFAGGDIVTGAATVIEAMGAGRKAARSMKKYL
ncbi:MAG TPA: NADPH-dependent glutamate synthase, partial [Burkholderiales bacterium]|nr:NADPH-dependent glutamate synthase [Burkholderiales bacterium]